MPRGALKSSLLLVGTLGMADARPGPAAAPFSISLGEPADLESIIGVVHAWAQAWHRGDQEGMRAQLHPDMKVIILENAEGPGHPSLDVMGVQAGFGSAVPDRRRRAEVRVLDVQGRCASARVDLGPWIAYLHLAAHRGGWAIANVLWEWNA